MIDQQLVDWIDHARSKGATYDHVAAKLQQAGHPDVKAILDGYSALTDHHGRRRDQTNPGDPADPVATL
jgi:hypothetical protein